MTWDLAGALTNPRKHVSPNFLACDGLASGWKFTCEVVAGQHEALKACQVGKAGRQTAAQKHSLQPNLSQLPFTAADAGPRDALTQRSLQPRPEA